MATMLRLIFALTLGFLASESGGSTWSGTPRKAPGKDGATSTILTERDAAGDVISKKHVVTKDGQVIHQHQDHIGTSGSVRSFPEEWTGTTPVNDRPVDPQLVPQGPRLPNEGPDAVK